MRRPMTHVCPICGAYMTNAFGNYDRHRRKHKRELGKVTEVSE